MIFAQIIAVSVVILFVLAGLYINQPEQSRVITMFGSYKYTDDVPGLRWAPPWYFPRFIVSKRLRNFESQTSKVNDASGNPIEISAIVVWRVSSPEKATFSVDDFKLFVHTQSESAVRILASRYPYDFSEKETDENYSLRANGDEISQELAQEISKRVNEIGVEIIDARINHLAYAVEIASAMLKRQQAAAILDAREVIVKGSVEIVKSALVELEKTDGFNLDPERKAAMVSNLMVVLSSGNEATPVINTGSLY